MCSLSPLAFSHVDFCRQCPAVPVTFKMANKVFIEETDKNFHFITEILFRFLGFGDFKIPIVTENKSSVLFGNETSSGVRS